MVDLRAKPFYLDDEGVKWVEETFASLSDREKIGQLFCEILWDRPGSNPDKIFEFIEPGAVMYRPFPSKKMYEFSKKVQAQAKVPLLIACNLERGGSGGNGGLIDGTYVASPMGVAATNDPKAAYNLAKVACEEGGACGVNWTFEPIIDMPGKIRQHASGFPVICCLAFLFIYAFSTRHSFFLVFLS